MQQRRVMMLQPFRSVIAVGLCGMLSGCGWSAWEAKWGPDKPHISYVSLEPGKTPPDKLYVWNPNNNAAYVFREMNGKERSTSACLASADVAKARNTEGEIKIDLGKILEDATLEGKQKILDTVTKLSERNEAASFLNVALFHICMMAGAEKIKDAEVGALIGKAIEEAAKITKPVSPVNATAK